VKESTLPHPYAVQTGCKKEKKKKEKKRKIKLPKMFINWVNKYIGCFCTTRTQTQK